MSICFATPWTVAHQAPLFMGFCRQVYWSGLAAPSPGDFPDPSIEPLSPVLAGRFFTTKPPGKPIWLWIVVVIQSPSRVHLFVTPWTAAHQAFLSFTIFWSLLKLMSIESVMPSNHLSLCCPLLLLPLIFPSIKVFSNESALRIRWPKYWSFSFSISPSNEYSRLISFWLTGLISLQSKGLSRAFSSTTYQKHQFFGTQPSLWSNSHPYMTTGKTITLTIWTFTVKVLSRLFNTLYKFVITFLPRSKHRLISWLQSPSAVILEPKKIKSVTVSTVSLYIAI